MQIRMCAHPTQKDGAVRATHDYKKAVQFIMDMKQAEYKVKPTAVKQAKTEAKEESA